MNWRGTGSWLESLESWLGRLGTSRAATPAMPQAAGPRRRRGKRSLRVEALETRDLMAFDPSPFEQEMLEDVNRMRGDPQGELAILFESLNPLQARDPNVQSAIYHFHDPTAASIAAEWPSLQSVAPVAWNSSLYDAAIAHSERMIQADQQAHQLPGEASLTARVTAAGYTNWSVIGENIFAFSKSVSYGHAGFVLDWGVPSRGHRNNMMDASYREVGIGIVSVSDPLKDVGPLVVTEDFGDRDNFGNSFVLGVVYQDVNHNDRYDAGEGVDGAQITVTGPGGPFTTTSMTAGGYQLRVPAGTYTVTATGGGLAAPLVHNNVAVGAANVKVDFDGTEAVAHPQVVGVTSSTANGTYGVGAMLSLLVQFSEPVLVTGTPTLTLETGATDRTASYVSGSGTTTLRFDYTVQAGDHNGDLDYTSTSALQLAGGSIANASSVSAQLGLPAPGGAGSLAANKNLAVDAAAPQIATLTPSVTTIRDAQVGVGGFQLTVTYNEPMDPAVVPTITFPVEDVSATLTRNVANSRWTNSTTYVATYDVVDANQALPLIDVAISGGRDLIGLIQTSVTVPDRFGIGMMNPQIVSIQPSDLTLTDQDVGKGKFGLTIVFSETMNMASKPVVAFPTENPGGTLSFRASQSRWTSPTTYLARFDVKDLNLDLRTIDVRVTGAIGVLSQAAVDATVANLFDVEMRNPSLVSVTPNKSQLNSSDVGPGALTLTVQFDERMNRGVAPKLSFPREKPGSTLKLNTTLSRWLDDQTYLAVFDLVSVKSLANIDVAVGGAIDLAGNVQRTQTMANLFSMVRTA